MTSIADLNNAQAKALADFDIALHDLSLRISKDRNDAQQHLSEMLEKIDQRYAELVKAIATLRGEEEPLLEPEFSDESRGKKTPKL